MLQWEKLIEVDGGAQHNPVYFQVRSSRFSLEEDLDEKWAELYSAREQQTSQTIHTSYIYPPRQLLYTHYTSGQPPSGLPTILCMHEILCASSNMYIND